MGLPNSYMYKTSGLKAIFDGVLDAQAPERFSQRFLEQLGFRSKGDRLFIGLLKDLGFLDADGKPIQRYYDYLDKSQSQKILAQAIEEAYSDLFAVNTQAHGLPSEQVKGKLRTLYAGKKTDGVITQIAKTFEALCQLADFSAPRDSPRPFEAPASPDESATEGTGRPEEPPPHETLRGRHGGLSPSLQYHINIVLPESRDQGVYDAIFKSLRDHRG